MIGRIEDGAKIIAGAEELDSNLRLYPIGTARALGLTMNQLKSKRAYYESLPGKRMGAGCLISDEGGRILLVKPGYKPVWEIPGGVVEQDESPRKCCRREVLEEIGLSLEIGRLLVVDYNSTAEIKTESLMFIFDGGTLTPEQTAAIELQPGELIDFGFFTPETLPNELTDTLKNRVLAAYKQLLTGGDAYLENQL